MSNDFLLNFNFAYRKMGDGVNVAVLPTIVFSPSTDNCKEFNSNTMSMILDNHKESRSHPLMTSLENRQDSIIFPVLTELENHKDFKSLPLMDPENHKDFKSLPLMDPENHKDFKSLPLMDPENHKDFKSLPLMDPENHKDVGNVPLKSSQENQWPFPPLSLLENRKVLVDSLENHKDCRAPSVNSSFDSINENTIFTPLTPVENEKVDVESGLYSESPIGPDEFHEQLKTFLEVKENSSVPQENIRDSSTIMPPTPEEQDSDKEVLTVLESDEDIEKKWKFPLSLESETDLKGLSSDLDNSLSVKTVVEVLNPENEDVEMVDVELPSAEDVKEVTARSVQTEQMEKDKLKHLKPIRVVPITDCETDTGSGKTIKMKKLGVTVRVSRTNHTQT